MLDYRSTFVDTKKLNVNISKSKNKTEPACTDILRGYID